MTKYIIWRNVTSLNPLNFNLQKFVKMSEVNEKKSQGFLQHGINYV